MSAWERNAFGNLVDKERKMTTDREWDAAMTEAGYMPTKDYVAAHTPNELFNLKTEIAHLKFIIAEQNAYIAELEARYKG